MLTVEWYCLYELNNSNKYYNKCSFIIIIYNIIIHTFLQIQCENGYPIGYDEIFDNIFPPEEWEENGKTWRRLASPTSANRQAVIELKKELNSQLKYWRAKEHGLCQIRRELYNQFFSSS